MTQRREALKYDKPLVPITVRVRVEHRDWLRLHGDQSARIRALIDADMASEQTDTKCEHSTDSGCPENCNFDLFCPMVSTDV